MIGTKIDIKFQSRDFGDTVGLYFLNLRDNEKYKEPINKPVSIAKELLRTEIDTILDDLKELFLNKNIYKIQVNILEDIYKIKIEKLGSFNFVESEKNEIPTFTISSHFLLALMKKKYKVEEDGILNTNIEEVWYHEFAHFADWLEIIDFYHNRDEATKDIQKIKKASFRLNAENIPDIPNEWILLDKLETFRAEGIAELFVVLSNKTNESVMEYDFAKLIFKDNFNSIVETMILIERNGSFENINHFTQEKICKQFELFNSLAYKIGPLFVLDALTASQNENIAELANKAMEYIQQDKRESNFKDTYILINELINLDIGEILRLICSKEDSFIDKDTLLRIFHFLSVDDSERNEYPLFITAIIEAGVNNDEELFINALKQIIGCPMSIEEIEESFIELNKKKIEDKNTTDLLNETKKLYDKYKENLNETILLAVTYILDPEDFIKDNFNYIGFIDDYYVYKSLELLLKNKNKELA